MRFESVLHTFLFSLLFLAQSAGAGGCETSLLSGLHINIELTFDPQTGQPSARLVVPSRATEPRRTVPAAAHRPTLGDVYHHLMNRGALIDQMDGRLSRRKLLVDGGGLCGSTCAINVLHAVAHYRGADPSPFEEQPDYHLHRIVEETRRRFGADARIGITMEQIASGLEFLAPRLGLSIRTHVRTASVNGPITPAELAPGLNEIVIVGVRHGRRSDGNPGLHALVLTGLNTTGEIASYSDPNYPHSAKRVSAHYVYGPGGVETVQLGIPAAPGADQYEGCVDSYVRVTVPGL